MKLGRLQIATGNQDSFSEAFYVWVAHLEGNPEAYADAEKLAAAHPQLFDPQYYFGLISSRAGKTDAAVTLLKKALVLGANAEDRVRAATSLQQELSRTERHKEALDVLADQLKQTDAPELRAKLFVGMAKAHAKVTPVDHRAMFLMYELALKNTPDDTSLRFDVAFKYSEQGAHELAFDHYRRLLQNDPKHIMALNNIGVDAGLDLPLTAVSYFKSSQAMDNTLASSNLANRLIDAGFKEEAEAVLTTARGKPDVHRNVSFSIGKLAQAEATEEQQITKISERVGKVRRWRVRHGEAALQGLEPTTLSGSYTGVPVGLDLTVQTDGTAKGTFAPTATSSAVLTGSVTGAALTFDWTSEDSEKESLLFPRRKSGHRLLIATGDGQLDGYRAEGTDVIDAKDVDKWNQWHLSKKPAS